MASATAGLSVAVPSDALLRKARQFANQDFLSTHERNVKAESVCNYSAVQIMGVVSALNHTLKDTSGMQKVGEEIAACVTPLLTPDDLSPSDDIFALFKLTPDTAKAIKASSAGIKATLDNTCSKIVKHGNIDNYQTVFYMLVALVKYSRSNRVFDLHYAYVYARDTSLWQWARVDKEKRKRMASLEVEAMNTLFGALAARSNGSVPAITNDKEFEEELRELNA